MPGNRLHPKRGCKRGCVWWQVGLNPEEEFGKGCQDVTRSHPQVRGWGVGWGWFLLDLKSREGIEKGSKKNTQGA